MTAIRVELLSRIKQFTTAAYCIILADMTEKLSNGQITFQIATSDTAFVDDVNLAGLSGITAGHNSTLAFDAGKHIGKITLTAVSPSAAAGFSRWLNPRLKKLRPEHFSIDDKEIEAGDDVAPIIQELVENYRS